MPVWTVPACDKSLRRRHRPSLAGWSQIVLRLEAIVQVMRWRRSVHRQVMQGIPGSDGPMDLHQAIAPSDSDAT